MLTRLMSDEIMLIISFIYFDCTGQITSLYQRIVKTSSFIYSLKFDCKAYENSELYATSVVNFHLQ